MKYVLMIVLCTVIFSCTSTTVEENEAQPLIEIQDLQEALENCRVTNEAKLVHLVYLDIKDDITDSTKAVLLQSIDSLNNIEQIKSLDVGMFSNLDDPRAMSKFELIMNMKFMGPEDYNIYQNDPIHLRMKDKLGAYLSGPPVTYDYSIQ